MNSPLPASVPGQRRNWAHLLVNLLVALVVVAVAAATFVFSYDGVHAIALQGGVSKQLARYYPGLFDAVLVIACVAAIMLRDGSWWARLWAWFVIFILLAAIGTTDVLHATNYTLRHRPTEGIVAGAPVVAVLLAFSLLLTLLRRSRTHAPALAGLAPSEVPALPAAVTGAPIALPAAPEDAPPGSLAAAEVGLPEGLAPTIDVRAITPAPASPAGPPAVAAPPTADSPADGEPTVEVPVAVPAPPTVQVPALSPEPQRGGIRYAGSDVPGMAGKPQADEPKADEPEAAQREDYWASEPESESESDEDRRYAGLVYNAPDADDADDADQDSEDDHRNPGDEDDDPDDPDGESASRETPSEVDDDAPPFATAPFASIPRLNRVRSMPTPPADEDE